MPARTRTLGGDVTFSIRGRTPDKVKPTGAAPSITGTSTTFPGETTDPAPRSGLSDFHLLWIGVGVGLALLWKLKK